MRRGVCQFRRRGATFVNMGLKEASLIDFGRGRAAFVQFFGVGGGKGLDGLVGYQNCIVI